MSMTRFSKIHLFFFSCSVPGKYQKRSNVLPAKLTEEWEGNLKHLVRPWIFSKFSFMIFSGLVDVCHLFLVPSSLHFSEIDVLTPEHHTSYKLHDCSLNWRWNMLRLEWIHVLPNYEWYCFSSCYCSRSFDSKGADISYKLMGSHPLTCPPDTDKNMPRCLLQRPVGKREVLE